MGMSVVQIAHDPRTTLPDGPPQMAEVAPTGYGAWLGRVVDDRYHLARLIAEGGMGAVFEAVQLGTERPVALKVMHADLEEDGAIVQRFAREVEIGRRVKHENVVEVLDTGTLEDGSPYLVLELIVGPTLSHSMWEDGAFEWPRAVRVGAQIAGAIGAAWDAGFVHRDLKPDNIVLEPDGEGGERVEVLDFGIAHDREVTDENQKLTRMGQVLGTVGYMPPEQAVGQAIDVRADLYALGVLVWEMLAGFPLFDEDISRQDYLLAQMRNTPDPVRDLAPDAPPALTDLVASLLQGQPNDRPGDPWAVRDQLLAMLPAEQSAPAANAPPVEAAPAEAPRVEAAPVEAPPAAPAPAAPPPAQRPPVSTAPPPTSKPSSNLPLLVAAAALALLGALA